VTALTDSHSAVRAHAAVALGRIGHPAATQPLVSALTDSVFSVRIRSAFSLATLDYVPETSEVQQHYAHALDEFLSIVTGHGMMADDGNMHLNVGQIYEFRKGFDRALVHYRYALRFLPGFADLQNRTRRLLEAEARYEKLVDLLQPVVDRDPRAQVALGLAYVHYGKAEEGIGLLTRTTDAGVRSELVETGLGDGYRWLGQFENAEQHYRLALAINADFPGAHRGLALLAYTRGDEAMGRMHWSRFELHQGDAQNQVRTLMGTP